MKNIKSHVHRPRAIPLFSHGPRKFDASMLTHKRVDSQGKLHALGEPALCFSDEAQEWWHHGKLQSFNETPALYIEDSNACRVKVCCWNNCKTHEYIDLTAGSQVWCQDGYIHRDNGPAIVTWNNQVGLEEEYWHNGLRHRDGLPAIVYPGGSTWFEHGLLHRSDGPAVDVSADNVNVPLRFRYRCIQWWWLGKVMFEHGDFIKNFDYKCVPPEFALRALSFRYRHFHSGTMCQAAEKRACVAFPGLSNLISLHRDSMIDAEGLAQVIDDHVAGLRADEVFSTDGLIPLEV